MIHGIRLQKTFDEELEEIFLEGWKNHLITEMPIDELLKDVNIEYDFNCKKEFIDKWIVIKQNKVKGEWLIKDGFNVVRPVLLIQEGGDMEDILNEIGDTEFDRYNYLSNGCCLKEAKEIIVKQLNLRQGDIGVRLSIGFSINYKELK